ncbi:hypothetical protein OG762_45735 [Streptomyces sp. NBC_01136]|uniref:hypothetical protein n=1 Tax=unclassified Streptomyces TaxID=2593676 RepID=UPI003250436A|nr:hypothetical protein OG762_45735 [Streptomyces sp. NBC_01136]
MTVGGLDHPETVRRGNAGSRLRLLGGRIRESPCRAPERVRCPTPPSNRVLRMVDAAEYKRRQYPPGTKISPKVFGKDRRLPITNRWRESA